MPTLDTRGVLVALVNLLVLFVTRSRSQGLPPARQHDPFSYQGHYKDTFHLSHQLPDGKEMKIYLYKGISQRFFFSVERNYMALDVTVTPCASPIVWSLTRQPLPPEDYYDEPRVDPFMEQQQRNLDVPVRLGNWTKERRHTFSDHDAPAGMYVVHITSTRSDSVVRVLATTTGAWRPVYPLLPAADRKVRILRTQRRTVSFSWPDAAVVNTGRHLDYCVSVTKIRNFHTHCSLMAHTNGDKKPVLSKSDKWGFSWERFPGSRRKAKPVRPVSPRKIIIQQCVGSKREFTLKKARSGKTYYIDVYVIDKETKKAEAFEGAVVRIPGKTSTKKRGKSSVQIKDGERKMLKLKKGSAPKLVTFEAKHHMDLLSVEFGVCAGKVSFEILHNNTLVHQTTVKSGKRVRMKNVRPGTYTFRFPKLQRRKAFVSMYMTSRPALLTLPHDMSIKVFNNLTTCRNVTVAWMGTRTKQKYCLYVKELSKIRSLKRHRCSSVKDRPKSERVVCLRYRNPDIDKAVMMKTITGLRPQTDYVMDVYLSRGHSGPVAYKSVKVRTKPGC